jgi:hypothetical protein
MQSADPRGRCRFRESDKLAVPLSLPKMRHGRALPCRLRCLGATPTLVGTALFTRTPSRAGRADRVSAGR